MEMQRQVATKIIARVDMVSSHIPKYPIARKLINVPINIGIEREPNQAKIIIINIITGQGVLKKNFSNHTKKNSKGSKKLSISAP